MQWKPNVTVAAIVHVENRFLLVEESINNSSVFNQPAGHLEQGESLIDAVKREVLEETAWHFQPEALIGIYLLPVSGDISYLRFCFSGSCTDFDEKRELDHGILRTVWLTAAEIEANRSRHRNAVVLQCLHDYQTGKRYPLDILTAYSY